MNTDMNQQIPYFSFNLLNVETHQFITVSDSYDLNLRNMIREFETSGYLNNTLFILMSDHGSRLSGVYFQIFIQGDFLRPSSLFRILIYVMIIVKSCF
jgi:hypothetical protein